MWNWNEEQEKSYLQCALLSRPHGFFTADFYPSTPEEMTQVLDAGAQAWRTKQVHGRRVVFAGDTEGATHAETGMQEADGSVSRGAREAVWVVTADCVPALLEDVRTGRVAAVHAGWRSTALGIVPEAVRLLQAEGSRVKDLRVALGPAIAGEVYQVGPEVAEQMARALWPPGKEVSPEFAVAHLLEQADSPLWRDAEPGKYRLDVRRVNVWQLRALGLAAEQVAVAPHCTYQEPERFFSYRRTGERKNQWSGIVSG